ncbi:hypothetical protein, partial [Escherichia coli]
HLVQEFLNQARAQNTVILSATARAIDRSPYHIIRSGLLELLNDVRLAVLSEDIYHISRQLWPTNLTTIANPTASPDQGYAGRVHDGLIAVLSKAA